MMKNKENKKTKKKISNLKGRKNRGITLIALVITVIVLLILAGVTIATLTGENGILTRANDAAQKTGEANAEEQVQIAVAGSIGRDGNINNGELRDNLNQIDKIEGVPEEITDESYPIKVKVDGYEVKISKDGTVKKPGKWEEITNAEGETVITDGTTELKIGDYVNYDPTNGGAIADEKQEKVGEETVEYTYKSEEGTRHNNQSEAVADTRENMTKGNGYGDQYFSVESETNGWRVLGLDENTDEILLISADTVGPVSGGEEYNGQTFFYLRGQTGYEYGVEELKAICEIYGKGKGASGARSITVEDINKITGYDPSSTGDGKPYADGSLWEYGNEVTYTKTSGGIQFEDSLGNGSGTASYYNMFRYYEGGKWKTLAEGESKTVRCTDYYYSPVTLTTSEEGATAGIETSSTEYEMLFSRTSDGQDYWLASPFTGTDSGYDYFGLRLVVGGRVYDNDLFYTYGNPGNGYYGVRPVVSLESNVSISGGDGASEGTAYQIQ